MKLYKKFARCFHFRIFGYDIRISRNKNDYKKPEQKKKPSSEQLKLSI
jgi:hypothetical protein